MIVERFASRRTRETAPRHSVPLDILVVDDDLATRLSLTYALTDAGHKVTEAADGEEAIGIITEQAFDVAILDVRLPRVDGLTIFRRPGAVRREARWQRSHRGEAGGLRLRCHFAR